jgi:hypothetical protein
VFNYALECMAHLEHLKGICNGRLDEWDKLTKKYLNMECDFSICALESIIIKLLDSVKDE